MQAVSSISEFLLDAGTESKIFDLGRTIQLLDNQEFLEIESGLKPAPFPRQQFAWLGILFWNKVLSEQHYIWFVKLPLDEQGCVVTAHRDQFLGFIINALGKEFIEEKKADELPDNPYRFTPGQQQLADFNAQSRNQLDLPASTHYQTAREFLKSPNAIDWRTISIQGISDCVSSMDEQLASDIIENFKSYPIDVLRSLCASMENYVLPEDLQCVLENHVRDSDLDSDIGLLLLRAMSKQNKSKQLKEFISSKFQHSELLSIDLCAVIAGRYWHWCEELEFALSLCEAYAKSECFIELFPDLVQIPSIRGNMLSVLRHPNRSEKLIQEIGRMFGA